MRRVMLAMVLLGVAGCGGTQGQFESEDQEYRYLASLSNPTPEQFKRKENIERKKEAARWEQQVKDMDERDKQRKQEEIDTAKREKEEQAERIAKALAAAKAKEAEGTKASMGLASRYYKEILEKYPHSPEAVQAEADMRRCEAIAYGGNQGYRTIGAGIPCKTCNR